MRGGAGNPAAAVGISNSTSVALAGIVTLNGRFTASANETGQEHVHGIGGRLVAADHSLDGAPAAIGAAGNWSKRLGLSMSRTVIVAELVM